MKLASHSVVAVGILALCLRSAVGQTTYTVIEIETLGGPSSRATAVNNSASVVGVSSTAEAPEVSRAFRWIDGTLIDLGTFGGPSAAALDINDAGQITGWAETKDSIPFNETLHAFRWQNGTLLDLGTTGGQSSRGMAINAQGLVAGASQICWVDPKNPNDPCFPVGNEYTFFWDGDTSTDLGGLFGSSDSSAIGMNSANQIVGQSIAINGFQTARHAVLWQDGQVIDIGTLGGLNSWAFDINDAGIVAGFSDTPSNLAHHPFIYEIAIDEMTDIGVPAGFFTAEAIAINASGQIVGVAANCCAVSAFLFDGEVMHDLNELIPHDSGWTLIEATDINDEGWIVGYGLHDGAERGFLLKPLGTTCGFDIDCDGEIGLQDHAIFAACLSGPDNAVDSQCSPADLQNDSDVDLGDFGLFAQNFSGSP